MIDNRSVLQQQHVDCKIADVLLKKSTKQHGEGWDASNKDWTHMVLHLTHVKGGFGVTFNCVTKDGTLPLGHLPRFCSFVIFTLP
jgi:hypothetical protein